MPLLSVPESTNCFGFGTREWLRLIVTVPVAGTVTLASTVGLGSAVALLVFAIAEPALTMGGGTPSDTWIAVAIASSTGLAVFLVMLAGVGVTQYARKQFDADKKVSGVALGLGMMVLATVIYLALSLGGGIVLVLALGA